MDKIEARYYKTTYCDREHLCIFVNKIRLDEFLSKSVEYCLGLIPSLLNWYDNEEEKQYTWNKADLDNPKNKTAILPILLCPDDFDFWCTTRIKKRNEQRNYYSVRRSLVILRNFLEVLFK